jgi:hypothetical protein
MSTGLKTAVSFLREYTTRPSVVAHAKDVPSGENNTFLTLMASFVFLFIAYVLLGFFAPGIF